MILEPCNDIWSIGLNGGSWVLVHNGSKYIVDGPGYFDSGTVFEYDGDIFLFGGRGYDATDVGVLNDVWVYGILNGTWEHLSGYKQVNASINNTPESPGGVYRNAFCTYQDGLYIYGGIGFDILGNYGYLNDLWYYNITENIWMHLLGNKIVNTTTISGPGNLIDAALDVYGDTLILFGGRNSNNEISHDLWSYDILSNEWSYLVPLFKEELISYGSHISIYYDYMYIFGGIGHYEGIFL